MYMGFLMPQYVTNNKTFSVEIDQPIAEFELKATEITIETVTVGLATASWLDDSDTLRVSVTGVSVNMTTDAMIQGPLIPDVKVQDILVSDINLQIDIAFTSADGIAFQIESVDVLSVGDVQVTVNKLYQRLVDKLKPEFMKLVNYGVKLAQGAYEGAVDALNYKLATNNEFVTNLLGMPLNVTMTEAPKLS